MGEKPHEHLPFFPHPLTPQPFLIVKIGLGRAFVKGNLGLNPLHHRLQHPLEFVTIVAPPLNIYRDTPPRHLPEFGIDSSKVTFVHSPSALSLKSPPDGIVTTDRDIGVRSGVKFGRALALEFPWGHVGTIKSGNVFKSHWKTWLQSVPHVHGIEMVASLYAATRAKARYVKACSIPRDFRVGEEKYLFEEGYPRLLPLRGNPPPFLIR